MFGFMSLSLSACVSGASGNPAETVGLASVVGRLVMEDTAGNALTISEALSNVTPIVGAVCTLEGTNNSDTTDDDGNFTIGGLSSGSYILICKISGQSDSPQIVLKVVEVAEGEALLLGEVLATFPGAIEGVITLEDRTEFSGISAVILGTSYQATTDAAGAFRIADVPEGNYTLTLSKAGFNTQNDLSVAVRAGQVVVIDSVTLSELQNAQGSFELQGARAYEGVDRVVLNSRIVNATITANTEAEQMMASPFDNFLGAQWVDMSTSASLSYDSDGPHAFYLKFMDTQGRETAPVAMLFYIDTTPPEVQTAQCVGLGPVANLETNEVLCNAYFSTAGWTSLGSDSDPITDPWSSIGNTQTQTFEVHSFGYAPPAQIKLTWEQNGTEWTGDWVNLQNVVSSSLMHTADVEVTVPLAAEGDYVLTYWLRDAAEQMSEAGVSYFIMDTTAPSIVEGSETIFVRGAFNSGPDATWIIGDVEYAVTLDKTITLNINNYVRNTVGDAVPVDSATISVAYGPSTSYGSLLALGDGPSTENSIFQPLIGWQIDPNRHGGVWRFRAEDIPATEDFHFRVTFTDAAGNSVDGADHLLAVFCDTTVASNETYVACPRSVLVTPGENEPPVNMVCDEASNQCEFPPS